MEFFSLNYVAEQMGKPITGIVHIGGHYAEEAPDYHARDIYGLWFEAHPEYFQKMQANTDQYSTQQSVNALLSDADDEVVTFYITADEFASSMLKPAQHQVQNPHAYLSDEITLVTHRFDSLMGSDGQNFSWLAANYNLLVLDVQGAELKVWNGMGEYQKCFKAIVSEYSTVEFYEGVPRIEDLDRAYEGFERVYPEPGQELIHGDGLWVRR